MAKSKNFVAAPQLVGFLHSGADKPQHQDHLNAFLLALADAGYDEAGKNKNIKVSDKLFAEDDPAKLKKQAQSLAKKVDVLVAAGGTASALEAKLATASKLKPPIVYTSFADPLSPADNMTGVCARTTELDATRLALLNELMPDESALGALVNSSRSNYADLEAGLDAQADALDLKKPDYKKIIGGNNQTTINNAIDQAFKDWDTKKIKGAVITADPLFNNHRDRIIATARKYKIAAVYQWSEFADAGGLMSYGTNLLQAYTLAGGYVGRILDGDSPDSLKPTILTKFELVINLRSASEIPIGIPKTLYDRADRFIR